MLPLLLRMLKRAGNIVTFIMLVTLLLLNGTAHEFVHSFAAHEDTIDLPHSHIPGKTFFEKEHHHCDFLDLAIVAFDQVSYSFSLPLLKEYTNCYAFYRSLTAHGKIFSLSDRGPPIPA